MSAVPPPKRRRRCVEDRPRQDAQTTPMRDGHLTLDELMNRVVFFDLDQVARVYMKLLSVVSLMARLCLEAGGILKMMFGFGQAGRKHPNGSFPFIHRESFVGLIPNRFRVLVSLSNHSVCERSIMGFRKRHCRKD